MRRAPCGYCAAVGDGRRRQPEPYGCGLLLLPEKPVESVIRSPFPDCEPSAAGRSRSDCARRRIPRPTAAQQRHLGRGAKGRERVEPSPQAEAQRSGLSFGAPPAGPFPPRERGESSPRGCGPPDPPGEAAVRRGEAAGVDAVTASAGLYGIQVQATHHAAAGIRFPKRRTWCQQGPQWLPACAPVAFRQGNLWCSWSHFVRRGLVCPSLSF